jgi:hypothetical protein
MDSIIIWSSMDWTRGCWSHFDSLASSRFSGPVQCIKRVGYFWTICLAEVKRYNIIEGQPIWEDSRAATKIAKMGVVWMSSAGCMNPSNRVCRHTRRENSAQLHRYPAQKSIHKSTPSSVILVSPYIRVRQIRKSSSVNSWCLQCSESLTECDRLA